MDTSAWERAIDRVAGGAADWRALDAAGRAAVVAACLEPILRAAPDWVEAGCRAKGIDPRANAAGEEWLAGPMTTIRGFRLMAESLASIERDAPVALAAGPEHRRAVARVFPASALDRALYRGIEGEIWIEPGSPPTRAAHYRAGRAGAAGVAVVLGAGNVSSIGPLDALYMLAAHGDTVVLKLNPVNAYLLPVFERAFEPLLSRGALALATGGADAGEWLCHHPAVTRVHLTGSRHTYDAIMWGVTDAERHERRASGQPRLTKAVTAELGCVTPILAVPGPWSEADLEFQARQVAATVTHNASFNCVAGKVLVLARGWPQREAFLARVEAALARSAPRLAYYPGAGQRYARFRDAYASARPLGGSGTGVVPWTILPDVPPTPGEYALSEEAFCGVLATVTVDGADAPAFLASAVPFVNEAVAGTLSCMLLVHPDTADRHGDVLARAEADLRYGSVAVNVWSGVVFGIGTTTWGAYPGHTPGDIGSGVGVVHNTLLFDHPEKSVVRGPFRMWPTPVWFSDHRTLRRVGMLMTAFEADPSWLRLPAIVAAGVRG